MTQLTVDDFLVDSDATGEFFVGKLDSSDTRHRRLAIDVIEEAIRQYLLPTLREREFDFALLPEDGFDDDLAMLFKIVFFRLPKVTLRRQPTVAEFKQALAETNAPEEDNERLNDDLIQKYISSRFDSNVYYIVASAVNFLLRPIQTPQAQVSAELKTQLPAELERLNATVELNLGATVGNLVKRAIQKYKEVL